MEDILFKKKIHILNLSQDLEKNYLISSTYPLFIYLFILYTFKWGREI